MNWSLLLILKLLNQNFVETILCKKVSIRLIFHKGTSGNLLSIKNAFRFFSDQGKHNLF